MDLDFVSVHKHAKKELGQYPVILTSRLVNNPYIYDNDTNNNNNRVMISCKREYKRCVNLGGLFCVKNCAILTMERAIF